LVVVPKIVITVTATIEVTAAMIVARVFLSSRSTTGRVATKFIAYSPIPILYTYTALNEKKAARKLN